MSATNMSLHRLTSYAGRYPKQLIIGMILVIALIAFEIFNFDTTQYALANLLGNVAFGGLAWATILAIAFCGIDLAGLVRLFTPQSGADEPKEVWYLMGAWLLGATMNAVMTWWAVSLTLLNNDFGNEVLSRQQLLRYVPIFVAILVWLTRILFIGSISVAGEHLLGQRGPGRVRSSSGRSHKSGGIKSKLPGRRAGKRSAPQRAATPAKQPQRAAPTPKPQAPPPIAAPAPRQSSLPMSQTPPPPPAEPVKPQRKPLNGRRNGQAKPNNRIRQRPPRPGMQPSSINAGPRIES
jgi:hypothetical protein